jgi:lipoyl(octanoyl) transferase
MLIIENWGLTDYKTAWDRQKEYVQKVRNNPEENYLILCSHPSVITIGRNGTENNILTSEEFLRSAGISVYNIDRGGDVTLHNPGQLVGYPIFSLNNYKTDLHWFLREIEQIIIDLLAKFGIQGGRVEGLTGVWIERQRKICAMGLHCSRWITSHGFALNVKNNLKEFSFIVPCGIKTKGITSIMEELGTDVDVNIIESEISKLFSERF